MFRATQCSSSGESIVSTYLLVYITLCRWPSGMLVRVYKMKTTHQAENGVHTTAAKTPWTHDKLTSKLRGRGCEL